VLDSTAALNIPHRNGIGSWNAMEIIYKRRGDGLYVPLNFTAKGQTQWMIKNIARILGPTVTDRELLSFIFDGVRWKVDAPYQIRLNHNLESAMPLGKALASTMQNLAGKGYFTITLIADAENRVRINGPGPLAYIPGYQVPAGVVKKPDKPNEVRVVGDMGAPRHACVRQGPHLESQGKARDPIAGRTHCGNWNLRH